MEAPGEAAPEEPPPPSAVGPGSDKTRPDEAVEVEAHKPNTHTPEPARSRYIPREVRDRVLARAGHRCEFTSADGRRCTARAALEIEHEEPFAIFGRHDGLVEVLRQSGGGFAAPLGWYCGKPPPRVPFASLRSTLRDRT